MAVIDLWESHGLFIDKLTEEELNTYGRWTVGTNVPQDHPGYTKKVYVKSPWIAQIVEPPWSEKVDNPSKYMPGQYPFKDRKDTSEWEYVKVLDGRLDLLVRDDNGEVRRFPLEAGKYVDVPPGPLRAWEFPEGGKNFAMGTAVFRRLDEPPIRPGAGLGYEFHIWTAVSHECLNGPVSLRSWKIQYVDVLHGFLGLLSEALPDGAYVLGYGHHALARPGGVKAWSPTGGWSFGAVLYIQ